MSLFLPVLLLGLAAPAQQAVSAPTNAAGAQTALLSQDIQGGQQEPETHRSFDAIAIPSRPGKHMCLFIRSYYFSRRDDLAPEFQGMTTRDCGNQRMQKRIGHEHGRLVPVSEDKQQPSIPK